jgi:hypothetical protein
MTVLSPSKVVLGAYSVYKYGRPENALKPAPPQAYLKPSSPSYAVDVK